MSLKDTLIRFINLYNNQELDELMDIYTDDAVNDQIALKTLVGKEEIRSFFKEQFSRVKAHCIIQKMIEQDDCIAMEWTDPTGFKGCTVFYFRDNKINLQRGYWDKITYCKYHNINMSNN